MAKKDTYLALLRRGIDENTAHLLSDSGVKVGDIKKAAQEGRRICSLAPEKSGLTGTFAFLSDGAGSLF